MLEFKIGWGNDPQSRVGFIFLVFNGKYGGFLTVAIPYVAPLDTCPHPVNNVNSSFRSIFNDVILSWQTSAMTQIAIDKQIEAIRKVATEALKSKEFALKFLRDAGIIKGEPVQKRENEKKA